MTSPVPRSSAEGIQAQSPDALSRDAQSSDAKGGCSCGEGEYVFREEVARGGMGHVLRVWDRTLERELAMKVLRPAADGDNANAPASPSPHIGRRFIQEARVTAQLEHQGIVPVHKIGIDSEGRPFFTMRLVKGRDLKSLFDLVWAGKEGWNLTRAVGVIVQACRAVAHAHSHGVVHRDLKPANVMAGEFGEVYVIDWGLARVRAAGDRSAEESGGPGADPALPAQEMMTLDGAVLGTPAYMAPEQAQGRTDEVDVRSDVYALGAILYTLLVGNPPYLHRGSSVPARAVLRRVLRGPPERVLASNPRAPPELAAVCEKAMARSRERRYATSTDLAEELQSFLDGRVVRAYETGAGAELRKWVLRHKGAASASAVALAVFFGVLSAVLVFGISTSERLEREQVLVLDEVRRKEAAGAEAARLANLARERLDQLLRVEGLNDAKLVDDFSAEAAKFWPARPENVPAMEVWLQRAAGLMDRLPAHEETLRRLEGLAGSEAGAGSGGERVAAAAGESPGKAELGWQLGVHRRLVERLRAFSDPDPFLGTLASVERRLAHATTIRKRSLEDAKQAWESAQRFIADPAQCPLYRGLAIEPQLGLVPVGRDPASGLWEFAHLETGEPPRRDEGGKIVISDATGLVFVLIPGGRVRMGSFPPSKEHPAGEPNVDPDLEEGERPVNDVALDPFFLSKFEMTQGQWLRSTGANPSLFSPQNPNARDQATLLHPIEMIHWTECREVLGRMGLLLPTEAQWEYAARGGTTTVWWTGNEKERFKGACNLADLSFFRWYVSMPGGDSNPPTYENWLDDGYSVPAPVGSFSANPFALHDVAGNVREICLDLFEYYTFPTVPGTGERIQRQVTLGTIPVVRGGSWGSTRFALRSAKRDRIHPTERNDQTGVRPARAIEGLTQGR